MGRKKSYSDWLAEEFGSLIDGLDLQPNQQRFLISRWLEQLLWVEAKAAQTRNRYYALRLTSLVGAVLLPGLVSLNYRGTAGSVVRGVTLTISLITALSAAIEEFFHFGDRWRQYRQTAEGLKKEIWLFFQLSGPYRFHDSSHERAFSTFASRVEDIIQRDVDVYIKEVTAEKKNDDKTKNQQTPGAA